MREAKNVFVLRLLDARLQAEGSELPVTTTIMGNIQIMEHGAAGGRRAMLADQGAGDDKEEWV